MRIHAVGGLANRLRAVLSHRERDGFVEVGWQQDEPVSCAHFLDVFEPITRVSWGPAWNSRRGDVVGCEGCTGWLGERLRRSSPGAGSAGANHHNAGAPG